MRLIVGMTGATGAPLGWTSSASSCPGASRWPGPFSHAAPQPERDDRPGEGDHHAAV
ncbi:MAG: hypothetical protein ACRDOI_21570 [Trebonia sp.]